MKDHNPIYNVCSCISSGVLAAVAFSNKSLWAFSFFALIPLFMVLWKGKSTKKQIVISISIYGASYYIILLYWLFILAPVFPVKLSIANILILMGIFLISIINSLILAFPISFFSNLKKENPWDIVTLSFLYILGEWMQENLLPIAFPWGRLGVSVTPFTSFLQSASLFGGLFISFLVLITNGIIAYILFKWNNIKQGKFLKNDTCILLGLSIFLIINLMGGCIRISSFQEENTKIEVLLVQGNHSGLAKWETTSKEILKDYINLTLFNRTNETKIVVWPETAIPVYLQEEKEIQEILIKMCKENNITLLLGAFKKEEEKKYNALFKVSEEGIHEEAYYKQILVPFGEYLPFEKTLDILFPQLGDSLKKQLNISKGTESKIFKCSYGNMGGVICYESIFSSIARKAVKSGANILVVASNDSWFADSPALYEHHGHSIMRSVECNRYLLRASNTAVTSIIHPTGKVLKSAEPFIKTALEGKIEFIYKDSFYSKMGDFIIIPGILLCFSSIIKGIILRYKVS